MERFVKWICTILAFLMIAVSVGCNTVEGAGEDIEEGGEWIQEKSD